MLLTRVLYTCVGCLGELAYVYRQISVHLLFHWPDSCIFGDNATAHGRNGKLTLSFTVFVTIVQFQFGYAESFTQNNST